MDIPRREEDVTWRGLNPGNIVTTPGSAAQYRTGDWRVERPVFDLDKCNRCGLCYLFCPEGCISQNSEGYFEPDLYYCKGCGICAYECRIKAITMQEEG